LYLTRYDRTHKAGQEHGVRQLIRGVNGSLLVLRFVSLFVDAAHKLSPTAEWALE
jgi:hypothetical protein